jgi:hypothetical protein
MAPARQGQKKSPKVWSRAQTTVNLERAWISPNRKRIEESDEDDGEKTERNNKVLQNKKPTEECTANTFVVDGKIVSIRSTVNKCILEKSSRTRKRRK